MNVSDKRRKQIHLKYMRASIYVHFAAITDRPHLDTYSLDMFLESMAAVSSVVRVYCISWLNPVSIVQTRQLEYRVRCQQQQKQPKQSTRCMFVCWSLPYARAVHTLYFLFIFTHTVMYTSNRETKSHLRIHFIVYTNTSRSAQSSMHTRKFVDARKQFDRTCV